jgi:hypothetical protein
LRGGSALITIVAVTVTAAAAHTPIEVGGKTIEHEADTEARTKD